MPKSPGPSRLEPEEWADVDDIDPYGFADRTVALVGPHGATGTCALSAALARSRAVGLFESRMVFDQACALGFCPDLVATFAVDGPQVETLDGSAGPSPPPGVTFFSSGSTGRPKLITRTFASIDGEAARYAAGGCIGPADRVVISAPMFHAYGAGVVAAARRAGAQVQVVAPTELGRLTRLVVEWATVAAILPSQARLAVARRNGGSAAGARCVMVGTGPVSGQLADGFERSFGVPLGRNYGSTETGAVAWTAGPAEPFVVGAPFPGLEITIEAEETEASIEHPTDVGEVFVRTEDGTRHRMGDLGRWSFDGEHIMVLGRADGAPRRRGRFVPTSLVEAAAEDVAGVWRGRAIVTSNERLVLRIHGDGWESGQLRRHLRAVLGAWAVPDVIEPMSAPTTSATGKLVELDDE